MQHTLCDITCRNEPPDATDHVRGDDKGLDRLSCCLLLQDQITPASTIRLFLFLSLSKRSPDQHSNSNDLLSPSQCCRPSSLSISSSFFSRDHRILFDSSCLIIPVVIIIINLHTYAHLSAASQLHPRSLDGDLSHRHGRLQTRIARFLCVTLRSLASLSSPLL